MKKIFTILFAVALTANVFAQVPQKMSYQAVIRNSSSALVTSTTVGMQITILQGSSSGTPVYVETQTPRSNVNGLVSLEIGAGTIVSGTFATINWASGPYFIKTETDPLGGTAYTISGTSELLSVPYALHAITAESIIGGITETDPVFVASPPYGITSTDITNWNNKLDTEVDGSITNEIQVISLSNDTIYLNNGGFVKLPVGFDGQYSSLTGTPTNVSTFTNDAGYLISFTEVDGSVTNELQALSISNDTVYLSNGGFVKLPNANAWSLNGNAATIDGTNFIGTTDNVPLTFKVNNEKAGRIDPNGSTFFGYQSGNSNTSGIHNTANGYQSLFSNTTGNNNTANGYWSLYSNTTGYNNTANGFHSLFSNTIGYNNTANGTDALLSNTTGNYNTANGVSALYTNTIGNYNTATGFHTLLYNTIGASNTANGNEALNWNTSGSNNTATGYQSLFYNTSGNENTAIGSYALYFNTTGAHNTASGMNALVNNTTGSDNTANGLNALLANGTGNSNTAFGFRTLTANVIGNGNSAFGTEAGFNNITGSNNVFIGYQAGYNETGSSKLYIANNPSNPPLIYGDFSTGKLGIGTITPGAELEVNGQIKITGGAPEAGKILTSDATGLATWEEKESKAYGMIYRTTSFDIPVLNTWTNLPLDGGNSNLVNIVHNTIINPERISVSENGTYLIQYTVHFKRQGGVHHGVARLIKNSLNEIPGSYTISSPQGDLNAQAPLTGQMITTLSATDYINIQVATNVNVVNEVDVYSGLDLPAPTTKIIVSLTIVKIGE